MKMPRLSGPKMTNVTFLGDSLGPKKSTFWGGHTYFSKESGLTERFSSKSAEFRAFDRDLDEGASYFSLEMAEEILLEK